MRKSVLLALLPVTLPLSAWGNQDDVQLEQVYITGGADSIKTQPGSATLVDESDLETYEYTDIHRVLNQVPGVNIQEEDGYGLRPNIGMRGSSPERSKKVTVMEDGVLSGPAPYSAPAAYYFPNVSRMSAVEVFKGPSAIQYGPATVAGAINLVSRAVPYTEQGEVDLQLGSYEFHRVNAYYGGREGKFGYLLEGLSMGTTGFKDLDGGGDTGFTRNDFTFKTTYDVNGPLNQKLTLKLGYATEDSDETYVGLTRDDFEADPYRRYTASELDNMQWDHQTIHLKHSFEPTATSEVVTDVYRLTYSRDWFKLNSFGGGNTATIEDVLKNPTQGSNGALYNILTGLEQSVSDTDQLLIGNNGRDYVSQGIQTRLNLFTNLFGLAHEWEFGLRVHQDEIERNHTQRAYDMTATGLQVDESSQLETSKLNTGKATAIALYAQDSITIGQSTVTLGLRSETIDTSLEDHLTNTKNEATEQVLLPGAGIFTRINDDFGVLAGVYKGYVATSPGQDGDIDPEESINYEFGFRTLGDQQIEAIGFINDYSNLKGTCSFNNGCTTSNLDNEFNGGEVLVYGLEASWKEQWQVAALSVPVSAVYTFTQTEFQNSFVDSAGIFTDVGANVVEGDELPYVPEHRLNLQAGIDAGKWGVNLSLLYQSDMRAAAGQNEIEEADLIDAYTVVDLATYYRLAADWQIYGNIDNLLDKDYVVAAQPMGYRPGKPQAIHVGAKFSF
ncbi:TonB-dependent receptor [Bermanella marisrubri]|uniref:Putative TonB-dependent receptor protein n=1 Tax=Bermanella marisrubri TaxID=207949 RepID=Q1MZ94_9GAMM|nr:TonB-dependent receptor [Bermanella marisrubri]EAT11239.1 putative TonB-dependent receptor protein [Oceanobacter sp. RED65] [Bermanella marisrubri]QIZ82722.1 TonB-dependent receptor [Bermanella marisrubri]